MSAVYTLWPGGVSGALRFMMGCILTASHEV